ncbi:activated RNA polymerase II transcriptional coactivator p15-like [Aphidius gifuensis]|uniref:activated RNA polymerase II transcriptional coactivator p15-like n=1 Tax=Aphidius gifuensis TaxID=684658 RepID=UPI001CDB8CBB|nr:activated RNA polymerase II transcriptional coactivator p15-like [Aphidius gifuensis]XP_044002197.1 activated RNA polymerase II transcriptional coactivator p15-like [Aphidius gifuensis]
MFIHLLQRLGSTISHCRPLTSTNSFVRVISSSSVRDSNRDKYEDIWANDFDSFLKMPKSKEIVSSDDDSKSGSSSSSSSEQEQKTKKRPRKEEKKSKSEDQSASKKKQSSSSKNDGDKDQSWELGNKKRVAITEFRGTNYVDIREMYLDKNTGDLKPGMKGISLNLAQWEKLKENVEAIDKVVKSK